MNNVTHGERLQAQVMALGGLAGIVLWALFMVSVVTSPHPWHEELVGIFGPGLVIGGPSWLAFIYGAGAFYDQRKRLRAYDEDC